MANHVQPLLTIGIIFKNEICCLERCLKSLNPLREKIPCELIMADTGSDDGSREVAANYADVLFDFPWVDDFSAARNAIMNRASGKWYLTVDADESLDSDISELKSFFRDKAAQKSSACSLIQRNYESVAMDGNYSDFMAVRMIRMSLNLRYKGRIHESWDFSGEPGYNVWPLARTILHHDGYVGLDGEQGRAKRERNLALIREHLKKEPEDLAGLQQYIESGGRESDFVDILRKAVALVKEERTNWELLGPPIFRHAVREARERALPELREWIDQSRKMFPDSFFIRIDVEYITFAHEWDEKNYDACIASGKRYLKAVIGYRRECGKRVELMYGSLQCGAPYCEQTVRIYLADSYVKTDNHEQAMQMLNQTDCTSLDAEQIENYIRVLWKIHIAGRVDTAPALLHLFNGLQKPALNKKQAKKRMNAFYDTAANIFSLRDKKTQINNDFECPAHTLFLPLGKNNDLGRAAIILESEDLSTIQNLLGDVEIWDRFPIEVLSYSIQSGAMFPLPDKPLKLEEADNLAARLAGDRNSLFSVLSKATEEDCTETMQKLIWARGLVLIAVGIFNWSPQTADKSEILAAADVKEGIALAHLFAQIESAFLPRYYSQDILQEENILSLPYLHRFGWYCVQAFRALEQKNLTEYVHKLRDGLNACPEMNAMVEYLTKYTPQLQQKPEEASPELQLLAKQVKALLSAYPADDPAVTAIKESTAYQKVKHLIENSEI